MPRIRRNLNDTKMSRYTVLVADLADELTSERQAGQPWIEELVFPKTDVMRVTVIWDKWASVTDDDRAAVIRQAYEQVEGPEFRDRIGLAIGLTFPEAYESGLLTYQVIPAVRSGDPVTLEQCVNAMIEQGASKLFDSDMPQLWFSTEEEADACRQRLAQALPESDQVWLVRKESARFD